MLLAAALLQYLIVTVLLTVVIVVIATASGLIHPEWTALPQIAAYMALGCSMFVSLLLQSFASRIFPLVICAVARSVGARPDHGNHGVAHRAHWLRGARTGECRAARLLSLRRRQRANWKRA
jgi:hypothetical protein